MPNLVCPKCDSTLNNVVGIDKSLLPRMLEENLMLLGDFYQEIQIIQCGNCGCRYLNLEPKGFIKQVFTESTANKPKSFKVKLIDADSVGELSGADKQKAIDSIIKNDLSPEMMEKIQQEASKPKIRKKKNEPK